MKKNDCNLGLLKGIEALKNPNYHALNKYCGRNDRLLHAVLCAYAKHVAGNEDIGWEELSDILYSAIVNSISDDEFCKWLYTI